MKKIIAIILVTAALITVSVVYARDLEFHDGVYRGEKLEFDFGKPKNNNTIILPQDSLEPKIHGEGYVGRVEITEKAYEIILLGK